MKREDLRVKREEGRGKREKSTRSLILNYEL